MVEETIHESRATRSRKKIASYFRQVADAFDDSDPVPVDEAESVTVDPPENPELEVAVEREDETMELEFEVAWEEGEDDVDVDPPGSKATFELYEDSAGQWRWRLRHVNGNIIADGGEGYTKKANAKNGIESVKKNAPGAGVNEQD
jgi:amphi-Trp domain-containing protein